MKMMMIIESVLLLLLRLNIIRIITNVILYKELKHLNMTQTHKHTQIFFHYCEPLEDAENTGSWTAHV